jgi:hypothetical protein
MRNFIIWMLRNGVQPAWAVFVLGSPNHRIRIVKLMIAE